jgi:hypothetical protein
MSETATENKQFNGIGMGNPFGDIDMDALIRQSPEEVYHEIDSTHTPSVIVKEVKHAVIVNNGKVSIADKLLQAIDISKEYIAQLQSTDPAYAKALIGKLSRSNVKGSNLPHVRSLDDLAKLITKIGDNWEKITSAKLEEDKIICYQSFLPEEYNGYAGYATVRDIDLEFGAVGMNSIQYRRGYQNEAEDEYYTCSTVRPSTNIITIQLKELDNNIEFLFQWFAGPEISSLTHKNAGDAIVKCGVVIQPIVQQVKKKYNAKHSRAELHQSKSVK